MQSEIKKIYELHRKELEQYLYSLTRSRETAEDMVHDLFVKLITKWESGSYELKYIKPLMYRIAYHLFVDHYRRMQTAAARSGKESQKSQIKRSISTEEIHDAINEAMEQLTEEQSELLHIRLYGHISIQEAATMLGISTRKAYRELEKALKVVETVLKSRGIEASDLE